MDDAVSCLYDLPNTNSELTSFPLNFEFQLTAGEHVFAWVSGLKSTNNLFSETIRAWESLLEDIFKDLFGVATFPFKSKTA